MSEHFDNFIKENKLKIHSVGELLKDFEIDAKTTVKTMATEILS